MKITLKYLKTAWNKERLNLIQKRAFIIASDKMLKFPNTLIAIDAIWTDDHDRILKQKRKIKLAKHIFVSQFCDIAVKEYDTVCKLLKVKKIILVGDIKFFNISKSLLKKLKSRVEIIHAYFPIKAIKRIKNASLS